MGSPTEYFAAFFAVMILVGFIGLLTEAYQKWQQEKLRRRLNEKFSLDQLKKIAEERHAVGMGFEPICRDLELELALIKESNSNKLKDMLLDFIVNSSGPGDGPDGPDIETLSKTV